MPEITQIQGPAGGPDNVRRQDRSIPDEKFKKEMEPKIAKISESDADQEAKKKKQTKKEEGVEGEEEVSTAPPPESPPPAPFSLLPEEQNISPHELQAGEGKISPMESAQKQAVPSPIEAFVTPAPSADEIEDDAGMWGEMPESAAPEAPASIPPAAPQTAMPEAPPTEKAPLPQTKAPPTQKAPQTEQTSPPTKTEPPQIPTPSPTMPTPPTPEKPIAEESLIDLLQQIPGAPKPATKPTGALPISTKEKIEEAEAAEEAVPLTPTLTPTAAHFEQEKKKETPAEEAAQAIIGAPPEPLIPPDATLVPLAEPLPSYMTMNSQVIDLFERMAGVMTVMTTTAMTETVVTLNAPQFASSVFYGTQIIIHEYSTAPKAFNVQIKGTPQAVALFQGNANDLMAAFQHGNYQFRVNRLDTGYLDERPLFHRKEKASGEMNDQPD